jgi:hypothetical protein
MTDDDDIRIHVGTLTARIALGSGS